MQKPVEVPPEKELAAETVRPIEGELTLEELRAVSGGGYAGPVINGKSYSPLKTRFGVQ
ncbi:MAG: hypothetical protein KIS92_23120 [Planctomycetota bacterium]|nr:hypothetical protein [Planctomycetota bacterium]